jgi:hypothetical protein
MSGSLPSAADVRRPVAGTLLRFASETCGKSIDIILRSYIFRKPITYWTVGFKFGHRVVEGFAHLRPRLLADQFDLTVRDIDLGAAIKLDCCPAQSIFAERDLDVGIGRLPRSVGEPFGP